MARQLSAKQSYESPRLEVLELNQENFICLSGGNYSNWPGETF